MSGGGSQVYGSVPPANSSTLEPGTPVTKVKTVQRSKVRRRFGGFTVIGFAGKLDWEGLSAFFDEFANSSAPACSPAVPASGGPWEDVDPSVRVLPVKGAVAEVVGERVDECDRVDLRAERPLDHAREPHPVDADIDGDGSALLLRGFVDDGGELPERILEAESLLDRALGHEDERCRRRRSQDVEREQSVLVGGRRGPPGTVTAKHREPDRDPDDRDHADADPQPPGARDRETGAERGPEDRCRMSRRMSGSSAPASTTAATTALGHPMNRNPSSSRSGRSSPVSVGAPSTTGGGRPSNRMPVEIPPTAMRTSAVTPAAIVFQRASTPWMTMPSPRAPPSAPSAMRRPTGRLA